MVNHVYLDTVSKQLIISQQKLNFHLLIDTTDMQTAKAFCVGFIWGNSTKVINKVEEFI